jgi:hypothetical protein
MKPFNTVRESSFALAACLGLLSGQAFAQYAPYPAAPYYPPAAGVAYYPAAYPASAWPAGAAIGAMAGALAGAGPGPMVAGALLGGLIGHAATAPYVVPATPAYPPQPVAAGGVGGRAFVETWQQFAAPSGAAGAAGTDFAQRWQSFFEPSPRR